MQFSSEKMLDIVSLVGDTYCTKTKKRLFYYKEYTSCLSLTKIAFYFKNKNK